MSTKCQMTNVHCFFFFSFSIIFFLFFFLILSLFCCLPSSLPYADDIFKYVYMFGRALLSQIKFKENRKVCLQCLHSIKLLKRCTGKDELMKKYGDCCKDLFENVSTRRINRRPICIYNHTKIRTKLTLCKLRECEYMPVSCACECE